MQPFRYLTIYTLLFALMVLGCIAGGMRTLHVPFLSDPKVHLPSLLFQTSKNFVGELLVYCAYLFMESVFAPKSEAHMIPAFLITSSLSIMVFAIYWIAQRILTWNSASAIQNVHSNWLFYPITAWIFIKILRMGLGTMDWRENWPRFASFLLLGSSYILVFMRIDQLIHLSWSFVLSPVFLWDFLMIAHTILQRYNFVFTLAIVSFAWLKFAFCSGYMQWCGLLSSSPLMICVVLLVMRVTMVA